MIKLFYTINSQNFSMHIVMIIIIPGIKCIHKFMYKIIEDNEFRIEKKVDLLYYYGLHNSYNNFTLTVAGFPVKSGFLAHLAD